MKKDFSKYSVVLLAAGRSQRMGTPKMTLPFDAEKTFLEVITENYLTFGCAEIAVVVNEENNLLAKMTKTNNRIKIVINKHLEWQRFYSVQLGLRTLDNHFGVFIHNVDNPFVDETLLRKMIDIHRSNEYVVPVYHGHGGHPVLISSHIINDIIQSHDHSVNLKTFLSSYKRINKETENPTVLVNINTEEEFRKFKQQQY